jgi:DNA-binding IclR family transcriptional regulator
MPKTRHPEFVTSLQRGLLVLQTFSRENPQLTLSEVAALTDLTPATARRSLHTLEQLGYLGRNGRRFLLRPKVLTIGTGYLNAINAEVVLQPFLQQVANDVGGSSSVTVLDELDIVYIAHASLNRAIRLTAGVGSRYPVYPTSMGRVLLAFQPEPVSALASTSSSSGSPSIRRRTNAHCDILSVRSRATRPSGRARLRDRVGVAPHLRAQRQAGGGRELLGRDQPPRSRHDGQGAAAGAAAGRPAHRGHAGPVPGADQFGHRDRVGLSSAAGRRAVS